MNVVKRAITSVIRKPGKTAILLVITFILGNIIAGAVSVRQAVDNAEVTLRTKMSPIVAIGYGKIDELYNLDPAFQPEVISAETIERIGVLPYVKSFDYSTFLSLDTPSLKRYPSSETPTYFTFTGVNNPDMVDIEESMIRLVAGRVFNEQEIRNLTYVALISQDVANINNLAIGSVMTFENVIYDHNGRLVIATYDFEIIGIFEPVKQLGKADARFNDWENKMYTPNRALIEAVALQVEKYSKIYPEDADSYIVFNDTIFNTMFVLNDPAELEPFKEDVAAMIPKGYTVTTRENFDQVAAPVRSLQKIASFILYIAVGATVVIMSLLITLFQRDRKREMGIYLSLGERKIRMAGQILLEVIVVAFIAITLSLFSGNVLSSGISEKMLDDQIVAEQTNEGIDSHNYGPLDLGFRGYNSAVSHEDIAASYAVFLDIMTVLLFYGVGLGTVCLSVLIPTFYVTRLNPKKILMKY
ncbi:MAG: ABC transporter permease [Peptococcaceae bacterium]|nr:ABC transporter permease [Peptococcaceae bacterium]